MFLGYVVFLADWIDKLKLDYTGVINGIRMLNINNLALIIDAKLTIKTYTTDKIVLQHKTSTLYIYGQNLHITELSNTQTIIKGCITCISSCEVNVC